MPHHKLSAKILQAAGLSRCISLSVQAFELLPDRVPAVGWHATQHPRAGKSIRRLRGRGLGAIFPKTNYPRLVKSSACAPRAAAAVRLRAVCWATATKCSIWAAACHAGAAPDCRSKKALAN